MPLQSEDSEDEDFETEFIKLEMQFADEMPISPIQEDASYEEEMKKAQDSAESLSHALSNLNLEPEAT